MENPFLKYLNQDDSKLEEESAIVILYNEYKKIKLTNEENNK